MSDLKPEVIEPDPAATSIPNDQTVNKAGGDPSAPTVKDEIMADTEREVKAEQTEMEADQKNSHEQTEDLKKAESEPEKIKVEDNTSKPASSDRPDEKRRDHGDRREGRQRRYNDHDREPYHKRTSQHARQNKKMDASVLPETDDAKEINAQIDFYFGDLNLPQDKFLWGLVDGTTNNPVPLKTITNFSRMRRFKPYEAIVEAVKQGHYMVLEGEQGNETIKRRYPYDPTRRDQTLPLTVYAKGFGPEESDSQFKIEEFFKGYGTVGAVRLRRHDAPGPDEQLFKESAFCTFKDEASVKAFINADPKPTYNGKELKIMTKTDYVEEKAQLIRDGKMQPARKPRPFFEGREEGGGQRGGRGGHRGNRNDDRDPDDWKKRRDNDRKNGFRDDRNGRGGGRGGRGRGRGGRDRGDRDNRRRNDRNEDRSKKDEGDAAAKTEAKNESSESAPAEDSKKRAREDDSVQNEGGPAKKVDVKEDVKTETAL